MTDDDRAAANLALVRHYAERWLAGDAAAVTASYHDDMTLYYGGANPFTGVHAGKPTAQATLRALAQRATRRLLAVVDVMAGPQRACMVARERFTRDGESHDLERVFVYSIKDGKLHECWVFDQDQALVDRLLRD
jgi:ketosteroid isomerase-like protein